MRHFTALIPQWLVFCHLLSSVTASSLVLDPRYRSNFARQLDVVSKDNTCGLIDGTRYTCIGSENGDCCSTRGFCGKTNAYCGQGCQSDFGTCGDPNISTEGTCGGSEGLTCKGASMGSCCSLKGFCGDTIDHCGEGCQSKFGLCGPGAVGSAVEEDQGNDDEVVDPSPSDPPAESTSGPAKTSSKTRPPVAKQTGVTDDPNDVADDADDTDDTDDPSETADETDPSQSQGQEEDQQQQEDKKEGGNNMGLKVGLGVGISVGVIAIGGLAAWFLLKKRREAAGLAAAGAGKGAYADAKELETQEPVTELYAPANTNAVELPDQHYR